MLRAAPAVVLLVVVSACGKLRQTDASYCPSWEKDVAPVLSARCVSCHGPDRAEGAWRADGYLEAVRSRDDGTPRLVAGDPAGSLLMQAARATLPNHPEASMEAPELEDLSAWIACRAPARHGLFHPSGWSNPSDLEAFHGKALRRAAYSTAECQKCHGDDLDGGKAEVSCRSCHLKGPEDCSTCHGDATSAAPPRAVLGARATSAVGVGAHRTHLSDGPLHAAYDCTVCHATPKTPAEEGHYLKNGKLDELPAEVQVKGTSGQTGEWEHDHQTCERSACHAPSVDAKATNQEPKWTAVGQGQAECGACHGLPPQSHADGRCEGCHSRVYANGAIVAPALHANGTVELGDGSGLCTGCHGDATSPAPPRDVSGLTEPSRKSVGAHRAHLFASRFRGPIACTECHLVPEAVTDVGHIDSAAPAEVFPFADGVGVLARADAARPAYDPGSASCSNVYCHGGGARASRDTTANLTRTPVWTAPSSSVACGGCHGLPPKDNFHAPTLTSADCEGCHFETVGPGFTLKLSRTDGGVVTTTHLNGQLELGGPP